MDWQVFWTCTAPREYEIALGLLWQTSPDPVNPVAEDEIVLGLLWQTSPDPVNPVAINYSNACMVVGSSAWVEDMSDNYFNHFMSLTRPGQVIQHDK